MSIELKNVSYQYNPDLPDAHFAVQEINLTIGPGEFTGLIGHTGSGKSTLIQLLNGLLKPTSGTVLFDGKDVHEKGYPLKSLRQKVGLVFQYPEHQLFEETILKDVCYGPKNLGLTDQEARIRAEEALDATGLDESYYEKSPFELSGGEKRRVAIAGILAMKPEYLILDEPTAGLDPQGRDEILGGIKKLNLETKVSVILVSHSMEDVAVYADRLLVMNRSRLVYDDTPRQVFAHWRELTRMGLSVPEVTRVMSALKEKGFPVRTDALTVEEAKTEILKVLKKHDS